MTVASTRGKRPCGSALMTTSYNGYPNGNGILDVATGLPATPLDVGAGHVDPSKAVDPGLVYDIAAADYVIDNNPTERNHP